MSYAKLYYQLGSKKNILFELVLLNFFTVKEIKFHKILNSNREPLSGIIYHTFVGMDFLVHCAVCLFMNLIPKQILH